MTDSRRRELLALPFALAATGFARAQADYPNKPVTLIVPFAPGGIADLTARTVAQAMAQTLKQPFVVDNRPSAGSIVGSAAVAKAAHNLESSSAYLGALRLSRLSSELEQLTQSERVASVERGLESVSAELDIVRRELSTRQSAS